MSETTAPAYPASGQTLRQQYLRRWGELDAQYSTWRPRQKEIIDYLQPGRGRFTEDAENQGQRKDELIVNDSGVNAGEKLAAAMDTGITSPAREWFRLAVAGADVHENDAVSEALHEVQDELYEIITNSNAHSGFRAMHKDLVGPATSLLLIEEDDQDVLRTVHFPVGSYRLWTDARGRVAGFMRRFQMTVAQIVEEFCLQPDGSVDLSSVSQRVKTAWQNKRPDEFNEIMHVVEKRVVRQRGKIDAKNKPWASCWLEVGGNVGAQGQNGSEPQGSPEGLLRESGYDEQPFIAPRWEVIGQDAYGRGSPGWKTIGDVKGLQALERTSGRLLAKIADPPMNEPDGLRNGSILPGARNKVPQNAQAKYEPSVVIPPAAVTVTEDKIRQHESRVDRGHFGDVLYIISSDQRATPATATEIRAKQDERLLQLGGVFSQLGEALKLFIARALAIAQRKRRVSQDAIDAILQAGAAITIEFENILVAAQKTLGLGANDRLIAVAVNLKVAGRQEGVMSLDPRAIMKDTADRLGVKPTVLISDDEFQQNQQAAAQAQAAQQKGAAMVAGAPALKQLSETDPEQLQQLLQRFGPGAAAAAGAPN